MSKICVYCYGELKLGLTDSEVQAILKLEYGKSWHAKWRSFCKFMTGQTVGVVKVEGTPITVYYRCDVANFLRPKEERFFD